MHTMYCSTCQYGQGLPSPLSSSFIILLGILSLWNVAPTSAMHITLESSSVLGADPQTVNRLNGESFQQDAVASFNGYQYAVLYDADTSSNASVRYVSVARRTIGGSSKSGPKADSGSSGDWEKLTLKDYNQTLDDGHDMFRSASLSFLTVNLIQFFSSISLGISHTDGTLHLSWDEHDNNLNYRISQIGVTTDPSSVNWSAAIFGPILVSLYIVLEYCVCYH